jgi:hypothetical protein
VRTCLVAFFNKYLKGEDGQELDAPPPNHPEIEAFLRK